jgi:uncharacterized protein YpbB
MLLIKNLVNGIDFNKSTMSSDEMKYYKINKIASLSEKFKEIDGFVAKDYSETFSKKTKAKKAKSTEPKKSTIEITLELWKQNLSLEEIATKRKLTVSSIYLHFTKLIQMEALTISDIMSDEKIAALEEAFKGYNDEGLGILKEKHGNQFSWEELRLFKVSLKN